MTAMPVNGMDWLVAGALFAGAVLVGWWLQLLNDRGPRPPRDKGSWQ